VGENLFLIMGAGSNSKKELFFFSIKTDFIDGLQYLRLMHRATEKSPDMGKMVSFSTKHSVYGHITLTASTDAFLPHMANPLSVLRAFMHF
jgi:hypothetical protein